MDQFSRLVDEIIAQGIDEDTACKYAALIGDRPIRDQDDNILVMNGSEIVAKLKPLKFFEK